ncbi:hypothetical protein EI94DRAFT_1595924 [Lactarius quietus]|nr:hypothetical protein EI94DRAFT_1595924 [Lactarius quietus]
MLLHRSPSSLHTLIHSVQYANICTSCSTDLQHNKMPPLSLANGMWVGEIPLELRILTLPVTI